MVVLEIIATLLGLCQGVLVMLNKRSNWLFYTLQMAVMVAFSVCSKLYGDVVNSAVYFCIGVVGFIFWGKEKGRNISACSWKERGVYSSLTLVGVLAVYSILQKTNDPLPLLDAFTTVSSFVATYYMLIKKTDAWIIWFVNDIAYVAEYWLLPDMALYLLGLNVLWTGMAVASYWNWRGIMKTQKKRIYFAGKFCLQGEGELAFRLKEDYRAKLLGGGELLSYAQTNLPVGGHIYAGPFYCEAASNGDFTSTDCSIVLNAEYNAILNSDVFVAVFDLDFSVGTVVELGWAIQQNKEILIFYKEKEDSAYNISSEYWFAIADAMRRSKKTTVFSYRSEEELFVKLQEGVNKL